MLGNYYFTCNLENPEYFSLFHIDSFLSPICYTKQRILELEKQELLLYLPQCFACLGNAFPSSVYKYRENIGKKTRINRCKCIKGLVEVKTRSDDDNTLKYIFKCKSSDF